MPGTVIFLGAGATKSCGGPLTNEILPAMASTADPTSSPILNEFLTSLFNISPGLPKEQYPGLPLVMSLVDTAVGRREVFHPDWDPHRLEQVREAVELGIFDHLEEKLNQAQTTNHFSLLQSIFPPPNEPCVISTNYDLLIDTALMFHSLDPRISNGDGRLPNYHCNLQTDFYRTSPRFGTLLKLHGSLNCRTCHSLEFGASDSVKFLKILGSVVGQRSLKQSYTADGADCQVCHTQTKLRPLLIAPSHLKDYRNPHVAQVWHEAERVLRGADRVIFIGYSLPEDDVEVIYLLKRGLARAGGQTPVSITVVESDPALTGIHDNPVGRRYRTLFGDSVDWHPEGLDTWLAQQQSTAAGAGV